jgi:hypothetical protein
VVDLPPGPLARCRKLAAGSLGAITASLAVASSCAAPAEESIAPPDTSSSLPTSPIIPLAIGTRWTYDEIDSVVFTTDTSRHRSFHQRLSFAVIADTVTAKGTWSVLDSAYNVVDGPTAGHTYVANLNGGFWEWTLPIGYPVFAQLPPFLEFPYPARAGASANLGITTVLSTDTVMTVPAGTFHCLLYAESRDSVFVAPGVGVIARLSDIGGSEYISGQLVEKDRRYYLLKSVTGP